MVKSSLFKAGVKVGLIFLVAARRERLDMLAAPVILGPRE
jgi:hypothetical protein